MIATVQDWQDELEALHERIAAHFHRAEPRQRALGYLWGLLSGVKRKNGWQLAEEMGEARPDDAGASSQRGHLERRPGAR